jgi:hypothetical protein
MRNLLVEFVQRACVRLPILLAVVVALTSAGSAMAGRTRPALTTTPDAGGLPATPEPGAAIAFAVGIGVVAWAVRRNRNR